MKNKIYKKISTTVIFILVVVKCMYSQENITVGGTTRNMIVHAPTGIATNRPLVISLHGMNQDAAYQESTTNWDAVADTAKFVVVYPNGLNKSWDISGQTDINFILAVIDAMYTKYTIDKSRVYLTGFSMGGMMTYHAANNIADKIAAFGPVSGYMTTDHNSSRPIPIIHTHGTADNVVPYAAGNSGSTGGYFPGIESILLGWVSRDNCNTSAVTTSPYPVGTSNANSKKVWSNGDCSSQIVLISLDGKGHWHSNDAAGVYTTKEIWNFVRKYTNICGSSAKVSITSPANNATYTAPATINISATATISTGSITKVEFYNGTTKIGEDASSTYTYTMANIAAGKLIITAVATDNTGNKTTSAADTIKVNVAQAAYGGTPWPIPGTIQLENYDVGGNGFAYLDNATGNTGGATFRTDEDVDIENCTDVGTGYNIGFATSGEWLEYTVNVATAGKYDLTLRVACNGDGRTIAMQANGTDIATNIAIPNTAGWQTWTNVSVPNISLTAGIQVIRVTIGASDYVNLNYITFLQGISSVPLKVGWNVIGCPITGSTPIAKALLSIWSNVETVKNQDVFYSIDNQNILNSLTSLNWGQGYLVKVKSNCVLDWIVK